jgi:endonuclease-3
VQCKKAERVQLISLIDDDSQKMACLLARLYESWGREVHPGADDILAVLVRTILSQSTTRVNTDRAFASLVDTYFGDWGQVAKAPVEDVVDAIRVGGLARQKAPRIQAILAEVFDRYDEYSLESLAGEEVATAQSVLLAFPGVGPKTAAFVLMSAMGNDVFPMDTHIFRILERVGLLDSSKSASVAHREMEELIPEGECFSAHMVLVEHGRKVCASRNPRCNECSLNDICAFAREL